MKPLYLQYAKLEEDYGLAKRAMRVYDQATKAVPANEKLSMYEIYIARAAEIFGVPRTREIYEQAIESGLPDKDVKVMCLKYAELEKSLGEIDRARELYKHSSQFADPRSDPDFWNKWHEFEVQHGNEDTFREMLRVKRSVSASYSQVKKEAQLIIKLATCNVFSKLGHSIVFSQRIKTEEYLWHNLSKKEKEYLWHKRRWKWEFVLVLDGFY